MFYAAIWRIQTGRTIPAFTKLLRSLLLVYHLSQSCQVVASLIIGLSTWGSKKRHKNLRHHNFTTARHRVTRFQENVKKIAHMTNVTVP